MDFGYIEQNSAYINLLKDIKNNALNHAYLVTSEDEDARKTFFLRASLAILCPNGGCMECAVCHQIMNDNNVDIKVLDGKNKLKVDDITALTEDTLNLPIQGNRKLYFIDNAELMNASAQNKLLKTYEEPTSFVTIFLGVANESSLLHTLISRGKRLALQLLTTEQVYQQLIDNGVDSQLANISATYSMGNYSKAKRFAEDGDYQKVFEESFLVLTSLKNSSQIVEYMFNDIFSKEKILLAMDFFEIILSDVTKVCSGSCAPLLTINREFDIGQIAKSFTPAGASMALLAINEGRKRLNFNINSASVAERMLFDILEARYRWQ